MDTEKLIELLASHIQALDEVGAGNTPRLSFDILNTLRDALEASTRRVKELSEENARLRAALNAKGITTLSQEGL